MMKFRLSLCSILCVLILASCSDSKDQALGTLEWDRLNGRAVASEVITDVYIQEGEQVKAQQPLLKLDDSLQVAHVKQLEAGVEQMRWRLRQLQSGYRSEQIVSAQAKLAATISARKNTELNLSRQKNLRQRNLNSQRQLDDAKQRFEQALSVEEIALQKLKELKSGYRVEELEQARANFHAKQAELEYQQGLLSRYTILATRAGKVDSLPYKLGDKPPINAVLSTVLAGNAPWARVYLPETWLSNVSIGTEVNVLVDNLDETITGKIRFISSVPSFTPYYALSEQNRSRLMFITEIDLQGERAKSLPLGIPLQVKLYDNE